MPDMPQLGIAREHATTRIPTARAEQTVKEIREELSGGRFDYAGDVAVLADNTLVGLAPIERILAVEEDVPVADVMDSAPPVVAPEADQEALALKMVRRGESSVAVVDSAGSFSGSSPRTRCSVSY